MRSANAYFVSVLLHGLAVAVILLLAYVANVSAPAEPKVFELVAGAGDNYAATAAPALGSPGGLKLAVPAPPAPAEAPPAPPQPASQEEPSPVQPAPMQATVSPHAKAPAVPNLTKSFKRTIARVTTRLEKKYKKEMEEERRREQVTYDQYLKEHGASARARQIDAEGIREGVVGGSAANKTGGAGGRALTREEGKLLDAYYALLKARIKENQIPPDGVSDKLRASVEFYVAADGSLSRVRISQSSGNAAFDQSLLEAFAHTHSIGPRPGGGGETVKLEFRVHDEDAD